MKKYPGVPTTVSLIPECPCYGSESMRRYWSALVGAVREDDSFRLHTIHDNQFPGRREGLRGQVERFLARFITYPALIRRNFLGSIAHVLDHSWADMLLHVPKGAVKFVTVHDLIPLRFPGELKPLQMKRYRKWVSNLHGADVILSVSKYTKGESVELLGIPEEKIIVVPSGVDPPPSDGPVESLVHDCLASLHPNTAKPLRIGSIGSTLARKNLGIFPAALASFQALSSRRVQLVRVGMPLGQRLARDVRGVVGSDGLVEFGILPDEQLHGFYSSVDVIVIPSWYEGFGLPVLEAMAHGVPVISSNSSSLPEVGGDAALYFDPSSAEDLAAQLHMIQMEGCVSSLRDKGFKRAAYFTWRRCLEGIFEAYQIGIDRKNAIK